MDQKPEGKKLEKAKEEPKAKEGYIVIPGILVSATPIKAKVSGKSSAHLATDANYAKGHQEIFGDRHRPSMN